MSWSSACWCGVGAHSRTWVEGAPPAISSVQRSREGRCGPTRHAWRARRARQGHSMIPAWAAWSPPSAPLIAARVGVTLVEVLLALALLVLVAGTLVDGLSGLGRRQVQGELARTARALAQQKLVELETGPLRAGHRVGGFGRDFPNFTYRLTLEPVEFQKIRLLGLYKVRLVVEWFSPYDRNQIAFETYLAEHPQT